MQLLDSGSDSENDAPPTIKVNEEYARRYEHNKNREDLHRYEDLKKRGLVDDDSSDDSSSDDDDEDLVPVMEKELFDLMIKVRNRDPILKNKEVQFFKSDDEDDDEDTKTKSKAKKPAYLKDVLAKNLLEDGAELPEDDDDDDVDRRDLPKSYNEVQELNRRAVLEAAAAAAPKEKDDDDDDLLRPKEMSHAVEDEADEELDKKLDEYFGQDLDENAKFLKDFFKNKMWVDQSQGKTAAEIRDEDLEMVSEDEMEIEKQEEYEYRFQENPGDRVVGHAREVEGSVRKKVNARKEQRKRKEERMEIARLEREEELRHLKNLKKKENDELIKKIMKIAGIKRDDEFLFPHKELVAEFDPHEFDMMMKKVFNNEYYDDDDPEICSDMDEDGEIEKPDFDKEDELLGLPKGWDGDGSADGFLAAREKILKLKEKTGLDSEEEEEDSEEDEGNEEDKEGEQNDEQVEEAKQEKKRKLALLERARKEMLDEYYKLDYEDTIGDLKTRFRYGKTKPDRYGLTPLELLLLDEKELNEYVSIKKLAPYAEEWKVPNSKRNEIKKRARERLPTQGKTNHKRHPKKSRVIDDSKDSSSSQPAEVRGKEEVQDSIGDRPKLSRKARRKQNKCRREGEALPPSRLAAYGVLPPKTKKKGKE